LASAKDLPQAVGARHVKAFGRCGWKRARKTSGGHQILKHSTLSGHLSVPCSSKNVKRGTLAALLKTAGLTIEEYLKLFK
jgi:predicted RNA binding protein YcfA (HicA-like mRNA interferase family)